jgi:hypothetical protein
MFPGRHCHFLEAGCCTIYDERPQSPCRNFVCGWLQPESPFPESFRPDRSGRDHRADALAQPRPMCCCRPGRDPDAEMLDVDAGFARATGSPFYYQLAGERLGYGSRPSSSCEMAAKVARGERLW